MSETTDPLEQAVLQLLRAAGLETDDKDLSQTPARVARMWRTEFLAGYDMDPAQILAGPVTGEEDPDAVFVTDLSFHSMCPHHLVPSQGKAHVAYIPDGRLVGFGRLARLVSCFTQRLTLQERATNQVARALLEHLPARGAGCVMESRQLCLAIPGDQHRDNWVITSAFVGELSARDDLRARLMAAAGKAR